MNGNAPLIAHSPRNARTGNTLAVKTLGCVTPQTDAASNLYAFAPTRRNPSSIATTIVFSTLIRA